MFGDAFCSTWSRKTQFSDYWKPWVDSSSRFVLSSCSLWALGLLSTWQPPNSSSHTAKQFLHQERLQCVPPVTGLSGGRKPGDEPRLLFRKLLSLSQGFGWTNRLVVLLGGPEVSARNHSVFGNTIFSCKETILNTEQNKCTLNRNTWPGW